jgi:hypothetical protein
VAGLLPVTGSGETMSGAGRLVAESAERWRAVRRDLNQRRHQLAQAASHLYPDVPRVGTTALMCRDEWIPGEALELGKVALKWVEHPPAPAVTGTEPTSKSVRPLRFDSIRYPAYSDALAELARPALFENRPSYRMLSAHLANGASYLDLTRGRYFDGVNIGEALAHELAAACEVGPVAMESLPFRSLIGDPCDLSRRSAMCAITTLTLRRGASGARPSFLLHWRDPSKVIHAGGLHQVMPVGIFQPADTNPASARHDLSLWRSMVREFSEELLGTSEDYRDLGSPLDYDRWPFYRELSAARAAGTLRVFCLGVGADPLTLAVDILAVAVFASAVFDAVFGGLVAANAEGRVVRDAGGAAGVPFTGDTVERFAGGAEPMQAAGAAVLELAWRHRGTLLG